jgi:hypothetical protein
MKELESKKYFTRVGKVGFCDELDGVGSLTTLLNLRQGSLNLLWL